MRKIVLQAAAIMSFASGAYADRATDVITAIQDWNSSLSAVNRLGKYCRMAETPFTFYRGTNHLFWKDFANDTRLTQFGNDKTITWLQGDLHANNFGAFDDDNGDLVYEVNDFDESVLADYQYDVWRMATSLLLIARENGGFGVSDQESFIDAFTENYLDTVADVRGNKGERQSTLQENNSYGLLDNFLRDVENDQSRIKMLNRWTHVLGASRVFDVNDHRLSPVTSSTRSAIVGQMVNYGETLSGGLSYSIDYFRVKDVAQRLLAGIGSFGTPRYYVLIEGASSSDNDDRILDVKLQQEPTPYQFLGLSFQIQYDSQFSHDAQRHALGFNALTRHTDDHLGWMAFHGGTYSVRERTAFRETFETSDLTSDVRFINLAEQWGIALAWAHARADKDANATLVPYSFDREVDIETDGNHAQFRQLVRAIAFDYANQVQDDYNVFLSVFATSCN